MRDNLNGSLHKERTSLSGSVPLIWNPPMTETFIIPRFKADYLEQSHAKKSASKDVEREMHKFKRGQLKSGRGGKGGTVKSRKQAIAIGLSEARKKGKKVPTKRAS
jgi:hypothetical protein